MFKISGKFIFVVVLEQNQKCMLNISRLSVVERMALIVRQSFFDTSLTNHYSPKTHSGSEKKGITRRNFVKYFLCLLFGLESGPR